ncbi:MAG: hypothetical protein M1469_12555 [Bacteroidetes bacterium]|nr:hypothetical protein [Bacteroidota bacterium]
MTLISLMFGESELDLVIDYLLGAGVIIISMFALVGIALLHNAHGNSNFLQGKAGFIRLQNVPRLLNTILHGKRTHRGTLLFLAVGIMSLVLVLLFLTLAFSCVCFARMKGVEYALVGLLALVLLVTNFIQR